MFRPFTRRSQNYSPTSLLVLHHIFLTASFMKIPITNQLTQWTLLFRRFNLFPRHLFSSFFFYVQLRKFLPRDGHCMVAKDRLGLKGPRRPARTAHGPQHSRNPPELASDSSCSCLSACVQTGNNCRRFKLVNNLYLAM